MKSAFDLTADVAVVTGALGKLGSIWIEALLDAGARVFALDHPDARFSEEFKRLQTRPDNEHLKQDRADVRDRSALEGVCRSCLETIGVPTVLVNNAGIDRPPATSDKGYRLEDIPLAENREIFEVLM